jgi:hypothetical protein
MRPLGLGANFFFKILKKIFTPFFPEKTPFYETWDEKGKKIFPENSNPYRILEIEDAMDVLDPVAGGIWKKRNRP